MAQKAAEPFRVAFEFNTAAFLQSALTELLGHYEVNKKNDYPAQLESFNKSLKPFYDAITKYVESNS